MKPSPAAAGIRSGPGARSGTSSRARGSSSSALPRRREPSMAIPYDQAYQKHVYRDLSTDLSDSGERRGSASLRSICPIVRLHPEI